MGMWVPVLLALLVGASVWRDAYACTAGQCEVSNVCNVDTDCATGLSCSSCAAASYRSSICTRDVATPVSSFPKNTSLPFNKYAWVTTHNSYSILGESSATGSPYLLSPRNQEDNVTAQLNNGVRGLMLDMYDFLGDVWLCHSIGGVCYNYTAFQPVSGTLTEIEKFLAANPKEIITIFIEDYVHATNGLTKVFKAAGLLKYWFPVSNMPKSGGDWPTLDDMIQSNQRLLVFTSIKSKEASEGIAYEWNYLVENQYGTSGQKAGSCPNRGESASMNDKSRSLVLENYFPDDPNVTQACADNSNNLYDMLNVCYTASGNRWSNFLAVDFYKRSTGGGVFKDTDLLNGELQCGCTDINACKGGTSQSVCTKFVQDTPPPIASTSKDPSGPAPSHTGGTTSRYFSDSSRSLLCMTLLLLASGLLSSC